MKIPTLWLAYYISCPEPYNDVVVIEHDGVYQTTVMVTDPSVFHDFMRASPCWENWSGYDDGPDDNNGRRYGGVISAIRINDDPHPVIADSRLWRESQERYGP